MNERLDRGFFPRRGLAAFALLIAFVAAGCSAQQKFQDQVLVPQLQNAWPGIVEDARESGATDLEPTMEAMRDAMRNRDRVAMFLLWPRIRQAAYAGIQFQLNRGEIGPGVADSLRLRVETFDRGVAEITQGMEVTR